MDNSIAPARPELTQNPNLPRAPRSPLQVLVDNSPWSFVRQPNNGVPCVPYRGSATDTALLGVILPLLEALSHAPDVRPLLRRRFGMPGWFRGKGVLGVEDLP